MRDALETERQSDDPKGDERRRWRLDEPFDQGAEGEPSDERMEDFFEGWEAYRA